jgi:hypothetical protein
MIIRVWFHNMKRKGIRKLTIIELGMPSRREIVRQAKKQPWYSKDWEPGLMEVIQAQSSGSDPVRIKPGNPGQ